ncbi:carbonic anhydrase 2-like [Eurosta solidaginis]|uniref:carbonic anhydrase 2-like n=1 Tax=Eurosta solidaginis TaxID=178769 RepID=UPI0035315019
MTLKSKLLLLFNLLAARRFGDHDPTKWSHKDTTKWVTEFPSCGGSQQSPIDLIDTGVVQSIQEPLNFENYNETFIDDLLVENNGHSAEIALPETVSGARPMISGGFLTGQYEAHSIHLHWGSLLKKGSEHTINGKRYDAEMHIVHKNVKYADGDEASANPDGIAVLGVLLKIVDLPWKAYKNLDNVFYKLADITKYETNTTIPQNLALNNLLGNINTKKFYAYKGSLTTPPCSEAVIWHVLAEPLKISRLALYNLFTLKQENGVNLVNTYRPVQPLNGREVYTLV